MKIVKVFVTLALLGLLGTVAAAQEKAFEKLGKIDFPVSCTPKAQAQFNRAVAMLHSFWFPQAPKAFAAVSEIDPDCAMAHWGIAISQRANPLVGPPDAAALKHGMASIEKAKAIGPKTQRERDYIAAIELFYKDSDKLDHRTRVLAYEKAMERLYLAYSQDLEAAIFYALALNEAIDYNDKTYARQLKAAKILENAYAIQPEHPGVLHYLTHSYDFPPLATHGIETAKRYASVAPSAPHALHMPSHIFSMVGMWQESIKSNREALGVAKKYVHAMDFMVYAHLQLGQDGEAKRLLEESVALYKTQAPTAQLTPTGGVLAVHTAFAAIPARYAIERGVWADAATLQPRPSTPAADAITHFTRAMGAARQGDANSARKDIEQLESLKNTLMKAKQKYWADQVEIQRQAAAAWVAHAEGKKNEALKLMHSAAALEDASEKHVAMENRLWPMRELLGEMLLQLNEPAQALKEFEASFKAAPNRFRGYYGAAKAAEYVGDQKRARSHYEKLVELSRQADTERAELVEAKVFLAKK
jgi:tetratricopeptide (TPR) repeat protein